MPPVASAFRGRGGTSSWNVRLTSARASDSSARGGGSPGEQPPGQPERPDVDRANPARDAPGADSELRRPAARVAHGQAPSGNACGSDGARVAQPSLLGRREQPHARAGPGRDRIAKIRAVARLAAGGGEQDRDLRSAELAGLPDLARDGVGRPREPLRGQLSGALDVGAERHADALLVDAADPRAVALAHEQAHGVRTDIDDGDSHRANPRLLCGRQAATRCSPPAVARVRGRA